MKRFFSIITIIALLLCCLVACERKKLSYLPNDLQSTTTCDACGMVILDYAGPHAQVVWKDGKHTFYCDLFEIMPLILDKPQHDRMAVIYVQDFGAKQWGSYAADWLNANDAYYVIDSRKLGSMGISYVPFKQKSDADNFQEKFGGQIRRFNQITESDITHTRQLMHEQPTIYRSRFSKTHRMSHIK